MKCIYAEFGCRYLEYILIYNKLSYTVFSYTIKRNDSYSKLIYHSDEISALWTEIEREYSVDEAEVINASEQAIEI